MNDAERLRIAREALTNIVRLSSGPPELAELGGRLIAAAAVSALRQIGVEVPTLEEVVDAVESGEIDLRPKP